MDYIDLFHCRKCSKLSKENGCTIKFSFDDNDPSTCPFLYSLSLDLIMI